MKEYNVRRHYETKHQTYTGAKREENVKQMAASLQAFLRDNKRQENATIASYKVAQLIAPQEIFIRW